MYTRIRIDIPEGVCKELVRDEQVAGLGILHTDAQGRDVTAAEEARRCAVGRQGLVAFLLRGKGGPESSGFLTRVPEMSHGPSVDAPGRRKCVRIRARLAQSRG